MSSAKSKSVSKKRITRSEKGTPDSIKNAKKAFVKSKSLPKQSRKIVEIPVKTIDPEAINRAALAFRDPNKLKISKAAKSLINFLNLIPAFILILLNIINKHKLATNAVMLFVKLYLNSATKKQIVNDKVLGTEQLTAPEKNFMKEFADVFTAVYNKADDIDKGLIALAFIDVVRNEIPRIIEKSKQANYVNNERIFSSILLNVKEIKGAYEKTPIV